MKLCDMESEKRGRVRKLQDKLCVLAVEYKGVKPEVCAACQSPCGYGMELTDILGFERPRTVTPGEILKDGVAGRARKVSKVIRAMNRGRGK